MRNQRVYRRLDCRFPIEVVLESGQTVPATLIDVSLGGACLVCRHHPGTHPKLTRSGEQPLPFRLCWADGERFGVAFDGPAGQLWSSWMAELYQTLDYRFSNLGDRRELVRIRPKLSAQVTVNGTCTPVEVVDVSGGGVCLLTNDKLPEGKKFPVVLDFPEPLQVAGFVTRTRREGGAFRSSLRFRKKDRRPVLKRLASL